MAAKSVYFPYYLPGQTGFYARVVHMYTGKILDNTDGQFKETPTNSKIPLTEDQPSIYYFTEDRQVWKNGPYQAYAYTDSDELFSVAEFFVFYNREVSFSEMQRDLKEIDQDIDVKLQVPTYPIPGVTAPEGGFEYPIQFYEETDE